MSEKFLKWIWFPLSISIFGAYAIQRGFIAFQKTSMIVPWLGDALSIYFLTLAIGMFFGGIILDNVNSKNAILVSTLIGIVGIGSLSYTKWGFGILFGCAAVIIKLVAFSAPLKVKDGDDGIRISPQAASKNIGAAAFTFFLGSFLLSMSWHSVTFVLAILFGMSGILSYYLLPNDKIEGWKFDIFLQLARDFKFWAVMLYFFLMLPLFNYVLGGLVPELIKQGYSKETAINLLASGFLVAAAARWPLAWLGEKIGQWKVISAGMVGTFILIFTTTSFPLISLYAFSVFGACHTPNYWSGCKKLWGSKYIATVLSLGFVFGYFGSRFLK